jgi:hypothetical protein
MKLKIQKARYSPGPTVGGYFLGYKTDLITYHSILLIYKR